MNFILSMSLSGTCMLILYYTIGKVCAKYFSGNFQYTLLRFSLFYFFFPLLYLKPYYMIILNMIFGSRPYLTSVNDFSRENIIYIGGGDLSLSNVFRFRLLIILIWFVGALISIFSRLWHYRNQTRHILKYSVCVEDSRELDRLEALRKEYKIRRKITLYRSNLQHIKPLTFGVWKPEIVIPWTLEGEAEELVLCHELAHIKQNDVFMRIITIFIISFHWFNPLVHKVLEKMEWLSELSCDEKAVQGKSFEQRFLFAKAIAKYSVKRETSSEDVATNLSHEGQKIVERIQRIENMKEKKSGLYSIGTAAIIAMAVLLCSFTVFAYDDVTIVRIEQDSLTEFGDSDNLEAFYFEREQFTADNYSRFVNEDGSITSVGGEIMRPDWWPCPHDWGSGYYENHRKTDDGGCVTKTYHAKRCGICGTIEVGSLYYTTTSTLCTHYK